MLAAMILAWGPASPAGANEGKSALAAGIKAYQAGNLVEAYKILKKAQTLADMDETRASALIYLGMVYLSWDQKSLAAESIAASAALDPARKLSADEFPPEVIALFDRARPAGVGALALDVSPEGAEASLDGKPLGPLSGAAIKVPSGKHEITITKSGYGTQIRAVEIMDRQRTEVKVDLAVATAPLVISLTPPPPVREGEALAVAAGAAGGVGAPKLTLYYRQAGGSAYSAAPMTAREGGAWFVTVPMAGAKTGASLEYYATAEDSSGAVAHAGSPEKPYTAQVVLPDATPPDITHVPPGSVSGEAPLVITAMASDNVAIKSFNIFFKAGVEEKYAERPMGPADGRGNYSFTIPGQLLEAEEIFYYLVAADPAGNFRSLGGEEAPLTVRPDHLKPRREAVALARETLGTKPGKKVTIGAGAAKGYARGNTLFAINVESAPAAAPKIIQELAGEIVITSVSQASCEGEVIREYYAGAVRKGSLIRMRPSPPRDVAASAENIEEIRLVWGKSPEPEVKGYLLHRAEKLAGPYAAAARIEGRDITGAVDAPTPAGGPKGGVKYYYRLKSFNSAGAVSDYSATASAVAKGGPTPPAGLMGQSGLVRKTRLTWSPASGAKAEGYRIYRADSEKGEYKLIDEIPDSKAAEYLDAPWPEEGREFKEGVAYWYKIQAYDAKGRAGPFSGPVSAASMGKPPAPANLRVEAMDKDSVNLAWAPAPAEGISGYRLYRSASKDGLFEAVAEIPGAATAHYVDKNSPENVLRPDIDYYYKLTAINQAGAESEFSPAAMASSSKPLEPPAHLQATTDLDGKIALSWSPSADKAVEGYMIYRGATPQTAASLRALSGRETSTFEDAGPGAKGLAPGAVYYYSVRPLAQTGVEGESGEWARGATKAIAPAPEGFKGALDKSGAALLEWTPAKNGEISGYKILRAVNGGEFTEIAVVTESFYKDTQPPAPGAQWRYRIQAIDMDGAAGPMSGALIPAPKGAPAKPSGLTALPGAVSMVLAWAPPAEREIKGYEIRQAKEGAWMKIGFSIQPMWLVEDLAPDTEYEFAIAAVDNDGQMGSPSDPVKVRTLK